MRSAWRATVLKPSLFDCLVVSFVAWQFAAGGRWVALLADGDTGWHIRTGEWVLNNWRWPYQDLFSFSKPGEPWYAWEWLADVVLALCHRIANLGGVVTGAALLITTSACLTWRRMLREQANVMVAMPVLMLALGAASIHFLARPHLFTLLLWPLALAALERERASRKAIWWLLPLAVVWANLHGGFVALLASLALWGAGRTAESWLAGGKRCALKSATRYAALLAGCLAASLINPYGWRLHAHIASYLSSDWIRNLVEEFQSPRFRSEHSLYFELLLFASLMLAPALVRRGRISEAVLVIFWAHAALVSARHVPLFALLVAPLVAREGTALARWLAVQLGPRSVPAIFEAVSRDLAPGFRQPSVWAAAGLAAVVAATPASQWPRDFPEQKFPVGLVERWRERLAGSRVFTSDQWADYLIYRFYPQQRVYFDGRSDFYGRELGQEYLKMAHGGPGWRQGLDRWGFQYALVPAEWALARLLEGESGWRVLERDRTAVLFEKTGVSQSP